jgi:hypothetical protein
LHDKGELEVKSFAKSFQKLDRDAKLCLKLTVRAFESFFRSSFQIICQPFEAFTYRVHLVDL